MTNTFFHNIEKTISVNRLSTYHNHSNSNKSTLINYVLNAKIAENFYFLLQNLEVALRNAIFDSFKIIYPHNNFFFLNQPDSRERYQKRREKHSFECWKMICGAKHNLTRRGIMLNDGKIIAELNFGFWTKILSSTDSKYTNMWRKIFPLVFPNYTIINSIDSDKILIGNIINNIRDLRNRVFHYEPIFNQTQLTQFHDDIIKVLGWINKDLQQLSVMFDEFQLISQEKDFISKQLSKQPLPKKLNNKRYKKR
ncbi:Abi family protein [Poseidonibacter ostreae]|nr:Abi family protein [Poseidonibacter ostreae]